jgi:hypothetical protein
MPSLSVAVAICVATGAPVAAARLNRRELARHRRFAVQLRAKLPIQKQEVVVAQVAP